jgi:hypothetical protein
MKKINDKQDKQEVDIWKDKGTEEALAENQSNQSNQTNSENNQEIAQEPDQALNFVQKLKNESDVVTTNENKKCKVVIVNEHNVIVDNNGNGESWVRTNHNPIKIGDELSPDEV